ncbi:MAG: tRNA (adenosine(37)-N6)-threonylcarbamoyltransferase complex ATPase subunit type 1 TsaE [Aquificae bacterium]|nr:tRNA (adenosine(37)-N6)-threonylcarbamoyltransferase complex ATPase subunit type 1 TsaE [Aquificota bacterium]
MKLVKEVLIRSEKEMMELAGELAPLLKRGEVLCLRGELGAGKTTFVKGLAKALGILEGYAVRSPTFVLVNEYPTRKGKLIHVDLYRVKDFDYTELIPEGILAVEWEERNDRCDWVLEIEVLSPSERRVKVYKR